MINTSRIIQYYDLKPYIYTDTTTGKLHGMIVEITEKLLAKTLSMPGCENNTEPHFIYQKSTFKEVHSIMAQIKTPEIRANSTENRFLFPVLKSEIPAMFTVFGVDSVSVISLRRKLVVWNKFFLALWEMLPMGYLSMLTIIATATVMFIAVKMKLLTFNNNHYTKIGRPSKSLLELEYRI